MENKVIFESEEECAEFLCNVYNPNKEYCLRSLVPMAKQKGYIRKSAMEEAEEYEKHFARIMVLGLSCTIKDLEYSMRIIERLKSEIARLKK